MTPINIVKIKPDRDTEIKDINTPKIKHVNEMNIYIFLCVNCIK